MPDFSSAVFQVAADGKTAHERAKGESYRRELVDFGERVMFMPVSHGAKLNKLESKWSFGRYCGIWPRSDEVMVMTPDGVAKGRTFWRLPEPDRWTKDDWEELKGLGPEARPDQNARTKCGSNLPHIANRSRCRGQSASETTKVSYKEAAN